MKRIKVGLKTAEGTRTTMVEVVDYENFPEVGKEFRNGIVKEMEQVPVTDLPEMKYFRYDFFKVRVEEENASGDEDVTEYNIAISADVRVKRAEVLLIDRYLPNADCVEAVFKNWQQEHLDDTDSYFYFCDFETGDMIIGESLLEDYFNITPEEYEDAISNLAFTDGKIKFKDTEIVVTPMGVSFFCMVPYWFSEKNTVEIQVTDDMLEEVPRRSASDLHPNVCKRILDDIEKNILTGKESTVFNDYPEWWDLISTDEDECDEILSSFKFVCCADFKEFMQEMGVNRKQMSEMLRIPLRTIEDWRSGKSECKLYMRLMIAECLGYLKIRR